MKFTSEYDAPWACPGEELLVIKTGSWRYQRPVTKDNKCCRCASCVLYCPAGCVQDRGTHYAANLEYCKGCGMCARVCPVRAITMVRER